MTPRRQAAVPPKRAVAYIRVSSDQQAESGLSLEHQRDKVRAAATLHDLNLQAVVVDAAESAATLERPGMRRVLELVRAKKIDALIVLKLDRLTRNIRDLADLLDLFRSRKVALMSVSESLNTETAAGRMVTNMLAVIAQWEREAIGERTSAALSAKRARGERAGAIPYGYRLKADKQSLAPSEAERRILRLMVECRQAGYSLRDTADELNRKGLRTRAGQPWRFEYVRSAMRTLERQPNLLLAEL
jgi:DNA invertase Pin-like site-specific DNA recombinase